MGLWDKVKGAVGSAGLGGVIAGPVGSAYGAYQGWTGGGLIPGGGGGLIPGGGGGGGGGYDAAAAEKARGEQARKLREELEAARERALLKGRARGLELFGEGSLATRGLEERKASFADILDQRRAQMQGLTPEEQSAFEQQALGGISTGTQTAMRQLRGVHGATGLRGGGASAQQAQILREGQKQTAQAQQDIFMKNIAARRQALSDYEQTVQAEQDRAQRELLGQLTTEFGYGSLAAGESAGVGQQMAAQEMGERGRQLQQGGGKKGGGIIQQSIPMYSTAQKASDYLGNLGSNI
jgi:hypothetical protein